MVKVGTVYKSGPDIDIKSLPLKVKLKVLISHTIDTSSFLSGDFDKLSAVREEAEAKKIDKYVEAISAYLADEVFDDQSELYVLYDYEDKHLIEVAIAHPQFSVYQKKFMQFNEDLTSLGAFLTGALYLRRVL